MSSGTSTACCALQNLKAWMGCRAECKTLFRVPSAANACAQKAWRVNGARAARGFSARCSTRRGVEGVQFIPFGNRNFRGFWLPERVLVCL